MSFNDQPDDNLYIDSRATNHMVQFAGTLINPSPFKGNDSVMVGNGDKLSITHIGNKNIGRNLYLKDDFVVPKLKKNLISVSKFVKDNACSLEFTDEDFIVKDKKTRITLAKGNKRNDLYTLEGNLHEALAITKIEKNSYTICCQMGKSCKLSFPVSNKREIAPLTKIHYDLWGPAPVASSQGIKYYAIFVDDCYSLLRKGYICYHPQSRKVFISRHVIFDELHLPYLSPTTDLNVDSSSSHFTTFREFFNSVAAPSSFEENVNDEQPQLGVSALPSLFKTLPACTTEHLDVPTHSNQQDQSPLALAPISPQSTGSFSSTSTSHSTTSSSNSSHLDISNTPGIELFVDLPPIPCTTNLQVNSHPKPMPPSRPQNPSNTHHMLTRAKTSLIHNPTFEVLTATTMLDTKEPNTIKDTLSRPHWVSTMHEELQALRKNKAWVLVLRQPHMNFIGSKCVFKTKLKADGSVERFKARLVAKGYNQIEGVDFEDTFSPVIKETIVRIVFSIATTLNWPIRQLDVKNAFLHGDLKEIVFMEQPPGFKDLIFPHHVCRLKKAFYGLKQAPKAWFHKFSSFLLHLGFSCSKADPSLKQNTVAKSSAEAEYRSLASLPAEVTWVTYILKNIVISLSQPPVLFTDNINALHLTANPVLHARIKHVELDYHFVREKVVQRAMVTKFIPSMSQDVDILTKPFIPKKSPSKSSMIALIVSLE
uniref:Uncharacterized protein LOC104218727 n=1 Tax=Nicotiana sylvestris TaxID=4096 RepID=A0A1U7VRK4_NICSY|nr:PREDICTED: uncharacterized protein LOC104218727 [Nicotiana sylvestris]